MINKGLSFLILTINNLNPIHSDSYDNRTIVNKGGVNGVNGATGI